MCSWVDLVLPARCAALDAVRRDPWDQVRRVGNTQGLRLEGRPTPSSPPVTRAPKNARYALWKNPDNLSDNQQAKLALIAKTDSGSTGPTSSERADAPSSCCRRAKPRQALDQ